MQSEHLRSSFYLKRWFWWGKSVFLVANYGKYMVAKATELPYLAAKCNGVSPCLSTTPTYVPFSIKSAAAFSLPFWAAQCNAVFPDLSTAVTFAPFWINNSATLRLPERYSNDSQLIISCKIWEKVEKFWRKSYHKKRPNAMGFGHFYRHFQHLLHLQSINPQSFCYLIFW